MGLLKHAILPLFTLIHLHAAYLCTDCSKWAELVMLEVETEIDLRQQHMLGCLQAFNVGLAFMNILGLVTESAHFRGVVVVTEAILFTLFALNAYQLGINWIPPAGIAGVATLSALVHSREPGIFTKDKNAKLKKK